MTVIFLCLSLKFASKIRYEKTRVDFISLSVVAFSCNNKYMQKKKNVDVKRGKTMEEMKKSIIDMLQKIHNVERIRMVETFLKLTLKREQESKKD